MPSANLTSLDFRNKERGRSRRPASTPQSSIPQLQVYLLSGDRLFSRRLISRLLDGVEQHLERPLCLGAVLDSESKHDDLSFADREVARGRLPRQYFAAAQIPGHQDVLDVGR